jgi:hypothetical protein
MSERVDQAKSHADAAMKRTKGELKEEVQRARGLLRQLREDVRQKLVVAGMEAKEEWSRLELEIGRVELAAQEATDSSKKALHEMVEQVRTFAKRL